MNLDTWIADLVRPVRPLEELELPLVDARGHVLAADVPSQLPIPPWDNSAMDGFAVRTADLVRASATSPVRLAVTGEVLAGDAADPPLPGGAAIRIMTGAPLPSAADAVVPVEHTRPLGGRSGDWGTGPIEVLRAPEQGDNIRRSGEDVAAGDLLARTGEVLGPTRIAALASGGISRVRVHRRPRVALLLTGAELTCPGGELRRGSVPESNGILLASRLAELGHDLVLRETVDDDLAAVAFALERARRDVDLVITTGGVGPGTHDAVRQVLTPLPDVHRAAVAMKPARHQMGGLLPDGTAVVALRARGAPGTLRPRGPTRRAAEGRGASGRVVLAGGRGPAARPSRPDPPHRRGRRLCSGGASWADLARRGFPRAERGPGPDPGRTRGRPGGITGPGAADVTGCLTGCPPGAPRLFLSLRHACVAKIQGWSG
jgi:molybdopterin molybdotransferase